MTYKLVTGTTETLAEKVNEYLKDGWLLFGPPAPTGKDSEDVFYPEIMQALYTRS